MLREPIARAYSHWKMAKEFTDLKLPGQEWAYNLVSRNATFESRALEMMGKFDKCIGKQPASASGVENWIACQNQANKAFLRSVYDQQINMWREAFPDDSFCVLDDDYLRNSQTQAMTAVARFIGLSQFNWSLLDVHPHDHYTSEKAALPIDPAVVQQLNDFFARHGTIYYDHVKANGFWGCRPDVDAEITEL